MHSSISLFIFHSCIYFERVLANFHSLNRRRRRRKRRRKKHLYIKIKSILWVFLELSISLCSLYFQLPRQSSPPAYLLPFCTSWILLLLWPTSVTSLVIYSFFITVYFNILFQCISKYLYQCLLQCLLQRVNIEGERHSAGHPILTLQKFTLLQGEGLSSFSWNPYTFIATSWSKEEGRKTKNIQWIPLDTPISSSAFVSSRQREAGWRRYCLLFPPFLPSLLPPSLPSFFVLLRRQIINEGQFLPRSRSSFPLDSLNGGFPPLRAREGIRKTRRGRKNKWKEREAKKLKTFLVTGFHVVVVFMPVCYGVTIYSLFIFIFISSFLNGFFLFHCCDFPFITWCLRIVRVNKLTIIYCLLPLSISSSSSSFTQR